MSAAPRSVRRRWNDDGQVAGIEVVPFGFLILVVGALLLGNAWAVIDAKMAITAAAREATRAYVEAPTAAAASTAAHRAAGEALAGHGRPSDELDLSISTPSGWGRCGLVTIEARTTVPAVGLPFVGGFGRTFDVGATHSEVIDPYRSGLDGEPSCG